MNIAKGLCVLMTISDLQFGIDTTISGDIIIIGSLEFRIVGTLCYRECVRGRGTRVYGLEPVSHDSQNILSTDNATNMISPEIAKVLDVAIESPIAVRRSVRLQSQKEKLKTVELPQTVCDPDL